jgi:hypothetical protein
MCGGKLTRRSNSIVESGFVFGAHQSEHLARMRRQYEWKLIRAFKTYGPRRERIQAVGIDYCWPGAALDDRAHKATRAFIVRSESWPNRNHRRLLSELQEMIRGLVTDSSAVCFC